jgi:DNA repair protein RecO (recombination protein O)
MKTHVADAMVLRTYRYGEADRIVVFLTEDRGKKRGVAKNATNSRKRFGAALEPFTRGRVTYVEREGRELVRLERIEPSESPMQGTREGDIGAAAERLGYASYFAELVDEWAPDAMANERLFRLAAAVGHSMHAGGSVDALARYFEWWLLRLEGVYPEVGGCARCGTSLVDGAVLDPDAGEFACRRCRSGPLRVSPGALRWVRQAGGLPPTQAAAAEAPAGALRELEAVHARLIALHLEREPRSARVVRELRPLT